MRDDWSWDGPSLREETRSIQGHAFELLVSLVVVSIFLGLPINLAASWLFQTFSQQVWFIISISAVIGLFIVSMLLIPILTTTKEFHQAIEIPLPLLVSKQDVEVIRVRNYDNAMDTLHDALARRPAEERKNIAQILLNSHNSNASAARQEFVLDLVQFLFATWVAKDSARLLGPDATFHKSREVLQLQSSTVKCQWSELVGQVPNNHYFQTTSQGIPQKFTLPEGVNLHLSDIAQEVASSTRPSHSNKPKVREVTILKATVGHNTALRIAVITPISRYGIPKPSEPRSGLTARCILRNARDQRLHDLACEEELVAAQLNDHGQALQSANQGQPNPVERYTALHKKLYTGGQQPYLIRAYIHLDGYFRIRQFSFGKNRNYPYRLYAWGAGVSRLLAHMDIEEFMAILKDDGQKTPHRIF